MNAFLCASLFLTASSIAETAHLKVGKLLNAASSWSMLTWHTHTYTGLCCIQVSPDQPREIKIYSVGLGVHPSFFYTKSAHAAIYSTTTTTTPWQTRGGYKRSDRHTTQRGSAICVQGFDDSRKSAIHITYRSSLRPSSLRLPRHPWFAIVFDFYILNLGYHARQIRTKHTNNK